MAAKSTGNSTKKRRGNPQNLVMPWKPGQSGNPAGRKVGQRNRRTVIIDALKKLAEQHKLDPADLEEAIQAAGITKAIKGSFFHYQEISNGLYGKVTDKLDVTSDGKSLADLITAAHARRKERKDGN